MQSMRRRRHAHIHDLKSRYVENISLFHAYARKNNMWILDHESSVAASLCTARCMCYDARAISSRELPRWLLFGRRSSLGATKELPRCNEGVPSTCFGRRSSLGDLNTPKELLRPKSRQRGSSLDECHFLIVFS